MAVIDLDILKLSTDRDVVMNQKEFIEWYLRKHQREYTNKLFHNWNTYRVNIIGFAKPCSYASFRRVIWKLADEGFITALPRAQPKDRREELFGRTYYRLTRG
jgi:hypothetical protein